MKALVIGYGSIGMRHARLLGDLGLDVAVVSRRTVEAPKVFKDIAEAVSGFAPDYAIIASRTHEHRSDVEALAECGFEGTVLIEKPVFDSGDDMPNHQFERVFVGYNLRFHPALSRFKELLDDAELFAVHATVGQHLPDWRPDSDYRQSYSAIKAQGGGVLRDLSHELDYLNWMLGGWTHLTATGGHFSNLEIDSEDVFSIVFQSRRCPVVSVNMNDLDSTLRREILALTDRGTIRADLVSGTVEFDGETESFTIERDHAYIAQHQAAMAGDTETICTVMGGLDVMRMIGAAEAAAIDKKWVAA
jgi:predicted dehydrogenase